MKEDFILDLQNLKDKLDKEDFISLLHLIWVGRSHVSPQYYHGTVIVPYLHERGYCTPNQDTELYMPCLSLLALLKNGDFNGVQANQYKDIEESRIWLRIMFKKHITECMEIVNVEDNYNEKNLPVLDIKTPISLTINDIPKPQSDAMKEVVKNPAFKLNNNYKSQIQKLLNTSLEYEAKVIADKNKFISISKILLDYCTENHIGFSDSFTAQDVYDEKLYAQMEYFFNNCHEDIEDTLYAWLG